VKTAAAGKAPRTVPGTDWLRGPALLLALAVPLGACVAPQPKATVSLTVAVRADPAAPDSYDIQPGSAIAGARVELAQLAPSGPHTVVGKSDGSGRAVFMVGPGSYRVSAKAATHDPYCFWYGSNDVEVKDDPVTISLDGLWVACE